MATKKCPYCAEEIQEEAIYCRYCHHNLPNTSSPVDKIKSVEADTGKNVKNENAIVEMLAQPENHIEIIPETTSYTNNTNQNITIADSSEESINTNVTGRIEDNVVWFEPQIEIEGCIYDSYIFDAGFGKIDKRDKLKVTRYAIEQIFRKHGFDKVRLDGVDAKKYDQYNNKYENYKYWTIALPSLRFYPTEEDIINNSTTEITVSGQAADERTLNVIRDYTKLYISKLSKQVAYAVKERNKRIDATTKKKSRSISTVSKAPERRETPVNKSAEIDNGIRKNEIVGKSMTFKRRVFVRFFSTTKIDFAEKGLYIKKSLSSQKYIAYNEIKNIYVKDSVNPSCLWVSALLLAAAAACIYYGEVLWGIIVSVLSLFEIIFIKEKKVSIITSQNIFNLKFSKNESHLEEFLRSTDIMCDSFDKNGIGYTEKSSPIIKAITPILMVALIGTFVTALIASWGRQSRNTVDEAMNNGLNSLSEQANTYSEKIDDSSQYDYNLKPGVYTLYKAYNTETKETVISPNDLKRNYYSINIKEDSSAQYIWDNEVGAVGYSTVLGTIRFLDSDKYRDALVYFHDKNTDNLLIVIDEIVFDLVYSGK